MPVILEIILILCGSTIVMDLELSCIKITIAIPRYTYVYKSPSCPYKVCLSLNDVHVEGSWTRSRFCAEWIKIVDPRFSIDKRGGAFPRVVGAHSTHAVGRSSGCSHSGSGSNFLTAAIM